MVPLRAASGFRERFLSEVGWEGLRALRLVSERGRHLAPAHRTRYRGALRPFPVIDPDTGETHPLRVAYIWSSEEAESVQKAREQALRKAEEALRRIQRSLGGRHYRTKSQVDRQVVKVTAPVEGLIEVATGIGEVGRPTLSFARNEAAIGAAARTDGIYALATNLPGRLGATWLLRTYKDQSLVEQNHRALKGVLRVRPVFLHNDHRIAALVSVVGLALLVFGLIQADLRRRLDGEPLPGLLPEGRAGYPTGRTILGAFQGLGLTYTAEAIVLDRLTSTQRDILELLDIPIPWSEAKALTS